MKKGRTKGIFIRNSSSLNGHRIQWTGVLRSTINRDSEATWYRDLFSHK